MSSLEILQQSTRNGRESLAQVLRIVGSRDGLEPGLLVWSVLHFVGVGTPPGGMTMPEFESRLAGNAVGHLLDWNALVRFAEGIEKTFSCTIVAASSVSALTAARLCGELQRCPGLLSKPTGGSWNLVHRSGALEPAAVINAPATIQPDTESDRRIPMIDPGRKRAAPHCGEDATNVLASARPSRTFRRLAFSELRLVLGDGDGLTEASRS